MALIILRNAFSPLLRSGTGRLRPMTKSHPLQRPAYLIRRITRMSGPSWEVSFAELWGLFSRLVVYSGTCVAARPARADPGVEAGVRALSHSVFVRMLISRTNLVCTALPRMPLNSSYFCYRSPGRHNYDPNTFFVTELSPRTASMPDPDAKLAPYSEMDDDFDVKSSGLDVPPPAYSLSTGGLRPPPGGLRSRSRSPAPDRKGSI